MGSIYTRCSICGTLVNSKYVSLYFDDENRYVAGCSKCPKQTIHARTSDREPASRSSGGGGGAIANLFVLLFVVGAIKYAYDAVTTWGASNPVVAGVTGCGCCCLAVCAFALVLIPRVWRRNR